MVKNNCSTWLFLQAVLGQISAGACWTPHTRLAAPVAVLGCVLYIYIICYGFALVGFMGLELFPSIVPSRNMSLGIKVLFFCVCINLVKLKNLNKLNNLNILNYINNINNLKKSKISIISSFSTQIQYQFEKN